MKYTLALTATIILTAIFFPLITISVMKDSDINSDSSTTATTYAITEKKESTSTVTVFSSDDGETDTMSIKEYLFGTVSAEMPASFHEEALKAQTVASYTYLKWIKENADNSKKYLADITDDSSMHQAFLSEDELKKKWGTSYSIYSEKISEIIDSVLNEYMEYNGETAMTVFHAVSPGQTHSSAEIWTTDLPYLTGVSAPGDSLSPYYRSDVRVSFEDFLKKLELSSAEKADKIISEAEKDTDGRIKAINCNGKSFSETELRSIFSLNSPYFEAVCNDSEIVFTVYGKGHGIGMSQYSADYMARQGSTYDEILLHFYKGAKLKKE